MIPYVTPSGVLTIVHTNHTSYVHINFEGYLQLQLKLQVMAGYKIHGLKKLKIDIMQINVLFQNKFIFLHFSTDKNTTKHKVIKLLEI